MSCPCLPLRLFYFVNSLLIKVPIRLIRKIHGLWCELFLSWDPDYGIFWNDCYNPVEYSKSIFQCFL